MKLRHSIRKKLSTVLFLATFVLTLPLIAAAQGRIAFTSGRDGNAEIYVMNADGTNQTNLTNNPAFDGEPSFSSNASKIAFVSQRDGGNTEIYIMNADGTNPIRLTNNTATDQSPTFSPDGSKIAFTSSRDLNLEIYVMNADGSNQINLTNNSAQDFYPAFSPDGNKIAFTSERDGNAEIYVINADGTNPTRLTNNTATDQSPTFSPDGSRIAFVSRRDGNDEIYVMNSDGTNQINLTNSSAIDTDPTFSPDGSRIAFTSLRDGHAEIYVMNSNGTGQSRLTTFPANGAEPSWGGVNAPPTLSNVAVSSPVNEGGMANLTGSVSDPDTSDAFILVVNWGDGSLSQDYNYPAGTTSFSVTHQYLDDNPSGTASDDYTIKYQIFQNNHFIGVAEETIVTVNNVAPVISNLAVNPSTVTLGGSVQVSATYTDAGFHGSNTDESLTGRINWGDGTQDFLFPIFGSPSVVAISHQYAAVGNYTITVTVTDNDMGATSQTIGVSVVPPLPPAAPSNLKADTVGASQVTLSWTDNSNNESSFVIEECGNKNCKDAVQVGQTGANVKTYTVTALFANSQYYYRVRAFNAGGSSAYSNTVTVKTLKK